MSVVIGKLGVFLLRLPKGRKLNSKVYVSVCVCARACVRGGGGLGGSGGGGSLINPIPFLVSILHQTDILVCRVHALPSTAHTSHLNHPSACVANFSDALTPTIDVRIHVAVVLCAIASPVVEYERTAHHCSCPSPRP